MYSTLQLKIQTCNRLTFQKFHYNTHQNLLSFILTLINQLWWSRWWCWWRRHWRGRFRWWTWRSGRQRSGWWWCWWGIIIRTGIFTAAASTWLTVIYLFLLFLWFKMIFCFSGTTQNLCINITVLIKIF